MCCEGYSGTVRRASGFVRMDFAISIIARFTVRLEGYNDSPVPLCSFIRVIVANDQVVYHALTETNNYARTGIVSDAMESSILGYLHTTSSM